MPKKAWFFKNKTLLGILSVMLVFGTLATGCPTDGGETEPTTYTVTFNTDGGSAVPNQKVEKGKKVEKPANPTKAGNTFANWYRDSNKKTLWNFDTDVVVQDTTIYAKWVAGENVPSYKVTFDADSGTPVPAEQTVVQGEPVEEPPEPSKSGYIFGGWYNGDDEWDFSKDTVTKAITLKAKWTEAVTVTFNTNGGSAIASVTVAKGSSVYPSNYRTTKTGNVFDGWYKDAEFTQFADSYLTVTADITLYAKWTSTSELAQYAGVWRSDYGAYLLQDDGTAWRFSSYGYFDKSTWSPSQIEGEEVTFDADKTTFTLNSTTYTKNTAETKTPAAATALLGTWVSGGDMSMELKADKTAVLTTYNETITLGYCVDSDKLYLLAPASNLVIVSIDIKNDKPGNFSKPTSDTTLAGTWKLTKDGQDYYWTLDKDGKGTFHTLGASVPVDFTVTEDGRIDGKSYTISDDTLTLDEDIELTKVTSVSGSGAGGDPNLHGTWGNVSTTFTFNSDGGGEILLDDSQSLIWKAEDGNLYLYSSSVGSSLLSYTYTVSGPTLTLVNGDNSMELTQE